MTTILSAPLEWLASSPTRWYVVFCEAAERRWWDRLFGTPAGFSHVYALRWDGFNWIVFNPHLGFTEIAIAALASEDALDLLVEPGATVLEVEAFRQAHRTRGRWWIGPMTCVEQVKALLGLPVGWVYTPWQLYRYLAGCTDGIEAENARPDRSRDRGRAPRPARARHVNSRGERSAQGDQAGPHRAAHVARLG